MKKIVIFTIFSLFIFSVYAQKIAPNNSMLLPLPLHYSHDSVHLNFGVLHVPEVKDSNDIAYNDTVIANIFFRKLSSKVDPNKVVLVVEYPVFKNTEDQIQSGQCPWITSTVRKKGFNKWVAADKREGNQYMKNLAFLSRFMNEYYSSSNVKDKTDTFGFPQVMIKQEKEIPNLVADSVIKRLVTIAEIQSFEENIKRICSNLRKQGYIPVVIAGRDHILALYEPCYIQVPSQKDEAVKGIYSSLSTIRVANFVMKDFFKKYNLILIKDAIWK